MEVAEWVPVRARQICAEQGASACSFFSSHQSHLVTASEPPILINGHKMPGRQQPPHSVESAMIYRIGALRKQLSELRETSDIWVIAGWGLDRDNHSQLEGLRDRLL